MSTRDGDAGAGGPRFAEAQDPPVDAVDLHRRYLFDLSDGRTVLVAVTRAAADAWLRSHHADEHALDEWAVETGRRVLASRGPDEAGDVLIDVGGA